MDQRRPRVGIVGGGPGGLTLARILGRRGVAASVFERDASAGARPQGGSLDLHPETGQHAIKLAGLEAEFRSIARHEDQETRVYDRDGTLRFEEVDADGGGDRPEVDREALRRILLESLDPGVVRWGRKPLRAGPAADGGCAIAFDDGTAERFDLVVGADGARSRVRPLVSAEVPRYTGVTFVELGFEDVDAAHPGVARLVGRGTLFAIGENRALIAQRGGGGRICVYAGLRVPEGWARSGAIDPRRPDAAKAALAGWFEGWAPPLRALVLEAGERVAARPIVALPVGHRWPHREGVTLIGDAAHVMSPFSGQGANLAMRDAADLADALAGPGDWRAAVADFEAAMFARSEEAAAGAAEGIESAFADDALEQTIGHMQGRQG